MSRIRSIHPGLWTDEIFVGLSPFARLLFMGIWNECDDKGTFPWSPLQLKMRVLPADNVDAAALLDELALAGCIIPYDVEGKTFGAVRNFAKYQRPKKPNDIHPATEEALKFAGHKPADSETKPEPKQDQFPTGGGKSPQMEDGGEDGEKKVPPTPRKRGNGKSIIPEDWKAPAVADLPPKARALAEQWTRASYETHAEAFHGYWRSSRRMYADWDLTWANRIVALHSQVMRDQKFGNAPPEAPMAPKQMTRDELAAAAETAAAKYAELGNHKEAEAARKRAEMYRKAA